MEVVDHETGSWRTDGVLKNADGEVEVKYSLVFALRSGNIAAILNTGEGKPVPYHVLYDTVTIVQGAFKEENSEGLVRKINSETLKASKLKLSQLSALRSEFLCFTRFVIREINKDERNRSIKPIL